MTSKRSQRITGPMSSSTNRQSAAPRIFTDLAHLWPLLSPVEDYLKEAQSVHRVLQRYLGPEAHLGGRKPSLLELGAGGGHTLHHLLDKYDITAVDLSQEMGANCQRLNPEVDFHQGDMRTVRLGRRFDAVLIHDAIDYLQEVEDVEQTMRTAAAHLSPAGVVLVAPTYVEETFVDQEVEYDQQSQSGIDLTYFSYVHRPDEKSHRVETVLVYLIRKGGGVEVVEDRHPGGLFSTNDWIMMLRGAGFEVELDHLIPPDEDDGIGVPMFVGILQP